MKVYYAHSKRIYDTDQEKIELARIYQTFNKDNVICPNNDLGELGSIDPYLRIVEGCDAVVASEYRGLVGKGVYEEIKTGLREKKKCFLLRGNVFYKIKGVEIFEGGRDWILYAKINLDSLFGEVKPNGKK